MAREKKDEKKERRAAGGRVYKINGDDSPMMKGATAKSDGFKRGGAPKRKPDGEYKEGGRIEGEKAKERADRAPRTHKLARGGSPYSAGHNCTPRSRGEAGHEGDRG